MHIVVQQKFNKMLQNTLREVVFLVVWANVPQQHLAVFPPVTQIIICRAEKRPDIH